MCALQKVSLKDIEELLGQYESYPKDIRKERDGLRTKWIIQSAKIVEEINAGTRSR